jgi:EAL domain-containing protein (putative c-di-GMP-specific phosphodiesterase class I)/AmiR/NasT family two-component response regulator
MNPNRLLVVDDEPDISAYVADVAEGLGFDVVRANTTDQFWASYSEFVPSVVVLDLNMPQSDGVQLLRALAEKRCGAQIAIISGTDKRVVKTAERLGASHGLKMLGSLQKPVALRALRKILNKGLDETRGVTADELRHAIRDHQLVVHYQPKIDLKSEPHWNIAACEALVRWDHPQYGILSPETFIPVAEKSGLISPLTVCVLRLALEQIGRWDEQGLSLSVAVNIAQQCLNDLALPDAIEGLAKRYDVAPSRLILEITESGAMTDAALTMDILTRFRLKGFGLSLDDFGTGYSSLIQLHRMPFNEMKIDKSFVLEIGVSDEAEQIVRSIADLGHNLGLSLCAEGIECEEALSFVRSIGCETAQGYLVSKPVSPAELATFIQTSANNLELVGTSA